MTRASMNNLELGCFMYNSNAIQEYICPEYVVVLLRDLGEKIEELKGENPFSNSSYSFENDTFFVEAYNWDESKEQPYNFKYKDIKISWYKWLGRDTTINGYYSPIQIVEMYNDCVNSIKRIENELIEEEREDEDVWL